MPVLNGTVLLFNSKEYPFNNSETTVALPSSLPDTKYTVSATVISAKGEIGDIEISGKARNGFRIAYTGSATEAELAWSIEVLK